MAAVAPFIPADPALSDGTYDRLCRFRALVASARSNSEGRVAKLREALALIPNDPKALSLLADILAGCSFCLTRLKR